jgi:hypothetical protein
MKYCLFPPRDFKVQEMGAYETWWIFLRLWFLAVGGLLNSGIGNKNSQQPHFHMVSYWTSLINSCFVSYKIQPNLLYFVFQSFDFEYTWWRLYQKRGALDSQPQVIKFTSCLPMVGGSLRVLRLLLSLKLVAMI